MSSGADFLQAERILRLSTPLGDDVLLPERMVLREEISGLGEATLWVRSKDPALKPDALLGKLIDIGLELSSGQYRYWNLLVTDMIAGPRVTRGLSGWQIVMRPQMWLLSRKSDCRIWQDMSAVQVAETLLSEHGLPAPESDGVVGPVPPQHYSVQWNETDFAYLTRRLEADGLFYWFEHQQGKHVLKIASHASGYTKDDYGDVRFAMGSSDRNHINRFETRFSYTPGVYAGRDWNFTTPSTVPEGDAPSLINLSGNTRYEMYSYPVQGGYGGGARASEGIEDSAVERVARLRMQAAEAGHRRVEGASTVRTLAAGHRFRPYDVANPDNVFDEHTILAITHEITDASYETGGHDPEYINRFLALPSAVPATPDLITPQPRIDGAQVAIVAGPAGEEIHPDEFGRIKLWFPWDRRAKKDGSDSCWVRVTQNWAGTGWGGQVIPRIGMEVMVSYLDGDPDRPVVTGVVPNTTQKVPYDLPTHKTKAVWRSNTHKGEGFNEISFEDEAGQENMFLHAQRDQSFKVLNDQSANVMANRVENIGQNANLMVGKNQVERVGANKSLTVGNNGGVLPILTSLVGAGGSFFRKAAQNVGAPPLVTDYAKDVAGVAPLFGDIKGLASNALFAATGDHRKVAGINQSQAASGLAGVLSQVMPGSGTFSTIVEKFRSDTTGFASTEQIGFAKNTVVGQVNSLSVGKKMNVLVGAEYDLESKSSIFARTTTHTLHAKERFVIAGPGGSITIDASGITFRARRFEVRSPSVDFISGAPAQVAALRSDKPFVEECPVDATSGDQIS